MATVSGIEWTDLTQNWLIGCQKISGGCNGCYAIPVAWTRSLNPHPAIAKKFGGTVLELADGALDWSGEITITREEMYKPLKMLTGKRIFVNSMADLGYGRVPQDAIAEAFAVYSLTPQHHYQILTKRPRRVKRLLTSPRFRSMVQAHRERIQPGVGPMEWPLPNVWIGVSVENQAEAGKRIRILLDIPAAVRFLSVEPMTGPVDLTAYLGGERAIHWVIAGGETGPRARPIHPEWLRQIRDLCAATGTAFFLKQIGEWAFGVRPADTRFREAVIAYDGEVHEPPSALWEGSSLADLDDPNRRDWVIVHRCRRKAAGKKLDGRLHQEMPAAWTDRTLLKAPRTRTKKKPALIG